MPSSSPEYTKRGPSGIGTIVKVMPWGVRNCYYQTSQSKGADTVGGQSLTPSRYTKRVPSSVRTIRNLCLGEYEIANTRLLGQRARLWGALKWGGYI